MEQPLKRFDGTQDEQNDCLGFVFFYCKQHENSDFYFKKAINENQRGATPIRYFTMA